MKLSHGFLIALVLLFTCLVALPASSAQAHRLNVFAWLENNEIIVECNFGNNRPAVDAQVTILDKDTGQALIKGATDKTGHFSFAVPRFVRDGHTLAIDVNAGDGHRSEWVMPASELDAAASLSAGFNQESIDMKNQAVKNAPSAPARPQAVQNQPGSQVGPENLRMMIRDEMEQQLAPIRRSLAARGSEGPGLSEIIGGLGWIVGIVGIVLFFLERRKKNA